MNKSFYDDWETNKDDLKIWRGFWALWELRRKWNWANWFYQELDRIDGTVVEPKAWGLLPGQGYMKLCLWIAILRSVHEGITERLDSFEIPEAERVCPRDVLPAIPSSIEHFPAIKGSPFRDFRNAVFHCQWSPTLAKFQLDEETVREIELLHNQIGNWLKTEFKNIYTKFDEKYGIPANLVYDKDGNEWMPESFY